MTYGEWREAHPVSAELFDMARVLVCFGILVLVCWGFVRGGDSQAAPNLPPHTNLPTLADGITLVTVTVRGKPVSCLVLQTPGYSGPAQSLSCDWSKR